MHSINTTTVPPKSVAISPSSQDGGSLAVNGSATVTGVSPRAQVGRLSSAKVDCISSKLSFKFGNTTSSTVADLLALNPMRASPILPPPRFSRFSGKGASVTTSTAQTNAQKTSVSKPTSKRCGIDIGRNDYGIDSAEAIKKQQEYYRALHAARAQLAARIRIALRALHNERINKHGASRKRTALRRRETMRAAPSSTSAVADVVRVGEGKVEEVVDGMWSEEGFVANRCDTTNADCANWQGNANGYLSPVSTEEEDGAAAAAAAAATAATAAAAAAAGETADQQTTN